MSDDLLQRDILEGAGAIAGYMGWPTRRVTYMREKAPDCPIRKRPGLGLYAFKSELDGWLRDPVTLAAVAESPSVRLRKERP